MAPKPAQQLSLLVSCHLDWQQLDERTRVQSRNATCVRRKLKNAFDGTFGTVTVGHTFTILQSLIVTYCNCRTPGSCLVCQRSTSFAAMHKIGHGGTHLTSWAQELHNVTLETWSRMVMNMIFSFAVQLFCSF